MINTRNRRVQSRLSPAFSLKTLIFALVVCPIGTSAFASPSKTDSRRDAAAVMIAPAVVAEAR